MTAELDCCKAKLHTMDSSCSCNTGWSLQGRDNWQPCFPYWAFKPLCEQHSLLWVSQAGRESTCKWLCIGLPAHCFPSASLAAFGDKINCGINWLFKFTEHTTNCAGDWRGLMMKPFGRSLASFSFTHFFMFEWRKSQGHMGKLQREQRLLHTCWFSGKFYNIELFPSNDISSPGFILNSLCYCNYRNLVFNLLFMSRAAAY